MPLAHIGSAFFGLFGFLVHTVLLQEPVLKAPSG
jgi:hypothetical protein